KPELAQEEEPAPPAVRARPDVREARDGPGVHRRAGLTEELRGRTRRAVDVGVERLRVELADQVAEGCGRAAELAAVVDVENRGAEVLGQSRPMLAPRYEDPAYQRIGRRRRRGHRRFPHAHGPPRAGSRVADARRAA